MQQLYAYIANESTHYFLKEFYKIRLLMNDDAALKFEVPAKFCGWKSRFHFTPKLTLLNLNLLKERSYRTMLEIFNNQTSAKKKNTTGQKERVGPTSWTTPIRMKDCSLSFSRLICKSLSELLSSSQSLSLLFFLDKPLKFSLEYTGQICWNRPSLSLTGGS